MKNVSQIFNKNLKRCKIKEVRAETKRSKMKIKNTNKNKELLKELDI